MLIVTAAQMRELDRRTIAAGTPGWTLMQRAGQGATRALLAALPRLRRRRVVVVCGKGNNGGDGFVIARELKKAGVAAEVFLLAREAQVKGDAALALRSWRRARGRVAEIVAADDLGALQERLAGAACVVDAILGTGLSAEVTGLLADAIALINACGVPVFAVDLPSGLDSDRGVPLGIAVEAEFTATFGLAKIGQVLEPGVRHCGKLDVVDIGLDAAAIEAIAPPALLLDPGEVAELVPRRPAETHKGDCGHVLVIAGSRGKSGAAVLCSRGAARAGAGLVTVAVPESQQPIVAAGLLEAMSEGLPDAGGALDYDEERLRHLVRGRAAIACGPGLGTGAGARDTVAWLLTNVAGALVLDADALNCLAEMLRQGERPRPAGDLVITPHPGEMARLAGVSTAAVQADRVGVARELAAAHACVVVLKGARTVVAAPDGRLGINPTGNPGMASGGMGDVLTGVVAAFLAQGLPPFEAACLAVHAHGFAADLVAAEQGTIGLLAGDVAEAIPHALHALVS